MRRKKRGLFDGLLDLLELLTDDKPETIKTHETVKGHEIIRKKVFKFNPKILFKARKYRHTEDIASNSVVYK